MMVGTPKQRDLEIAREVKRLLEPKIPLATIKMYGSRARGTATWESDLDLYIEVDSNMITKEQHDFINDVTFEVGLKAGLLVSSFVITKERREKPLFRYSPFFNNVQKEGIPI
jgi:predicted nucleotidyltransferase